MANKTTNFAAKGNYFVHHHQPGQLSAKPSFHLINRKMTENRKVHSLKYIPLHSPATDNIPHPIPHTENLRSEIFAPPLCSNPVRTFHHPTPPSFRHEADIVFKNKKNTTFRCTNTGSPPTTMSIRKPPNPTGTSRNCQTKETHLNEHKWQALRNWIRELQTHTCLLSRFRLRAVYQQIQKTSANNGTNEIPTNHFRHSHNFANKKQPNA